MTNLLRLPCSVAPVAEEVAAPVAEKVVKESSPTKKVVEEVVEISEKEEESNGKDAEETNGKKAEETNGKETEETNGKEAAPETNGHSEKKDETNGHSEVEAGK